ncbi:antibiotic biosynthesis monooxygenase [Geodermatophilus sabuli]|uniref:Antibiotic biosynthesis monooxygenase n=1 Tax=Geodermatophilus sabuli TaxID=1564158 RepID=A0A285EF12_9ACTN|nr:antibiotic biosynthesis monooxygenase [Geodermatophilus sabuli]MBB3086650.1 quinol monooxygenase YgiN [Geodermatophilus sabuli]SNX97698.1 Antibiotic biosynthesis monooxygenase [Geodermatophilus sabuli]
MYARSTTMMIFPASMDEAIAYMGDEVWPAMRDMDGCVGLSMMCDRESGKYIATSAWEDRQAMQASDEHVHPMREQMVDRFGAGVAEPEIQEWEIAVLHREHASGDGACCRVTWLRTDPSRADQLLDMYRTRVMPRIQEMRGFCSLSMLIDRESGRAVGTAVFESRAALEASREQARMLREESVQAMGVDILDVAEMDFVLAHLRVPETV